MPEIDLMSPLEHIAVAGKTALRLPSEAYTFKQKLRNELLSSGEWFELFGGHRNFVIRKHTASQDEDMRVYWRSHEIRWHTLVRALLTEHVVASELGIPGRTLMDPNKPIEVSPEGYVMTRLRYVEGEGRYPWLHEEIQSGASLLHKLHEALSQIRFNDSHLIETEHFGDQFIHGDFGRQNTLFSYGTPTASCVIDYENLRMGSRAEDIARTTSLLLVDTQLRDCNGSLFVPTEFNLQLKKEFNMRMSAFLDTYPDQSIQMDKVIAFMKGYLFLEDYGDLNHMRNYAILYLNSK